MTDFWIHNPILLFEKNKLFKIWPEPAGKYEENLNAVTRLVILMTLASLILHNNSKSFTLLVGLMSVLLIISLYMVRKHKRESFKNEGHELRVQYEEINSNNPFSNVLPNEIHNNPTRKEAKPAYSKEVEQEINDSTKQMIKTLNKDNEDINAKLFRDLGDEYNFDNSMRQFYSMPNTQVPNNQKEFDKCCYGYLPSSK